MKKEPIIQYILQTNFGEFIGAGGVIPSKIKYEKDPDLAAHWDDVSQAFRAADAINNRFIAETSIQRGSDIRVRVVESKVTVQYKTINEFPKM